MTLWKVQVVALHRSRFAKSHGDPKNEDCLVSYLFTRTRREGARWAALETIVVLGRYDRGGDFYWDDARSIAETTEFKAPVGRRRKWKGWPAILIRPGLTPGRGTSNPSYWISRRTGEPLTEKEARRRNRISLTRRRRRKAREATEEAIPEKRELNVFYREFSPYTTRDAFAEAEPPGYVSRPEDEEVIERLHDEYEELESQGSPSGGIAKAREAKRGP